MASREAFWVAVKELKLLHELLPTLLKGGYIRDYIGNYYTAY